jgi:predicted metal-dependent enzyme (double-stranded beta helix superfamily)
MISGQSSVDVSLLRQLSTASCGDAVGYLDRARDVLQHLNVRSDLLDVTALERKPGGYARTLLFGDDRISIWAMVWDVGARTCVHDHHCTCCFSIVSGALQEVRFNAISETAAVPTGQAMLGPGYVACMLPSGPNIHQVVNDGACEAISLHVYGFDHTAHASSVDREYSAATH